MQSWIRHLAVCIGERATGSATDLLLGFKKGGGEWKQFGYEPQAEALMCELLDLYTTGMRKPVNFYIDTAFEYAWHLGQGEEKAEKEALTKWEGGFTPWCERADGYLELLLGPGAAADMEAVKEIAGKLYAPVVANMKEAEKKQEKEGEA